MSSPPIFNIRAFYLIAYCTYLYDYWILFSKINIVIPGVSTHVRNLYFLYILNSIQIWMLTQIELGIRII